MAAQEILMSRYVRWPRLLLRSAMVALCGIAAAIAQAPQDRNAAVYLYRGADREQRLIDGARQEGTLVLYTSLATTESIPLTQAFEKKYGVKVQLWRATSDQILQRTINEARGRRHAVDVIETNGPEIEALSRERLTSDFHSPHFADFPAWAIPPHRLWICDRMTVYVVAFNTGKVRRDEIPATYEGFADAKWSGRIGIEATDQEWMAAIVKHWGDDRGLGLFRKLAAMKPDIRKGHVLLSELVAAGEIPVGLSIYASNAESMKRRGGPIDWVAVEPTVVRPQALALARNAPHPHAALLFADFVLSPEGQQLYEAMGRFPSSRRVKSVLNTSKFIMVDPVVVLDEADKWQKIWNELFKR